MRRFGKASNHSGKEPPSEREALWLSKVCTIQVNNLVSVKYSPIQRHLLDPQRRKSSIMSRPLEAGSSCSHWTIFSMTTPRPPWRSTVSCPLNPRALPGVGWTFSLPWHSRTPRNASWTDFRLRDRRDRRLWGNRNGRLAQRSQGRHAERAISARGQRVSGPLATFALLRGAPAPGKGGALTTSARLVRRPTRGRGGDSEAGAATRRAGEPAYPSRVEGRRACLRSRESLLPAAFATCRCLNLVLAAFPRPRSSNRTCGFPASGFQSRSCLRPRRAFVLDARQVRP